MAFREIKYLLNKLAQTKQETKQEIVSELQVKTIDGESLQGSGNIPLKTINGNRVIGSGNITVGGGSFSGTLDDVPDGTTYKRVTQTEKNTWNNKADGTHTHNLNDLAEKSYNSLTDKPTIPADGYLLWDGAGNTTNPSQTTKQMLISNAITGEILFTNIIESRPVFVIIESISPNETVTLLSEDYPFFYHGSQTTSINLTEADNNRIMVFFKDSATSKIIVGELLLLSSYTDEQAQDAIGTILANTDTVDLSYSDVTPAITAQARLQMSVTSDVNGIKLVNDQTSPGANKVYGTDASGNKGWKNDPSGSSGAGQLIISIHSDAGANLTLTNQANSEQFLGNSNRNIIKVDLSNYTQVRLTARVVTASASANSPRLYVEYSTTYSTSVASYTDIGISGVGISLSSATLADSGWVDLVSGAKADVFVTILQNGGDGAADPALAQIQLHFR